MDKGKLCRCISIAGIALSLLVTVGLVLGQAASPEGRSTLTSTREWSVGETGEGTATVGDSMAPSATMDDGFWYQGRLTDGDGNPLANANVAVGFRIYSSTLAAAALTAASLGISTTMSGMTSAHPRCSLNRKARSGRSGVPSGCRATRR